MRPECIHAQRHTKGHAAGAGAVARGVPYIGRRQDGSSSRQLVIPCRDIERMLARGCRFVATLPDGRLIVERTLRSRPTVEMDRMGFEPTTFAGLLLTQCECVIQTKLDDRSVYAEKIPFFCLLFVKRLVCKSMSAGFRLQNVSACDMNRAPTLFVKALQITALYLLLASDKMYLHGVPSCADPL